MSVEEDTGHPTTKQRGRGGSPVGALLKMTQIETKLLLRDPATAIMVVALPLFLMTIFSLMPGFNEPFDGFGGESVVDTFIPGVTTVVVLSVLGLSVMPVYLATYRERGVLRRLAVSPASPWLLLAAQLLVNAMLAIAGVALMTLFAALFLDVSPPGNPGGFALAFLLATSTALAIGTLIGSLASNSKSATAIGLAVLFPLLFLAGVWSPVDMLPGTLSTIGAATPLGAGLAAIRATWAGAPRSQYTCC
ncbi:ABC transporter permease [Salinispora vitiensis]|uniref:ABC transporter permease n=1 Tax=Salinispora vitiensis TaxID=999544 RepID=UPI001CC816B1|nr:ABC transporter permease [Salinispora vitiensis]